MARSYANASEFEITDFIFIKAVFIITAVKYALHVMTKSKKSISDSASM